MNKRAAILELASGDAKASIDVELRIRQAISPYLTIDLDLVGTYIELAISMRGFERVRGRWAESVSGQGRDFILDHFGRDKRVAVLCQLWKHWHLNGLRAGTRHQLNALTLAREKLDGVARDRGLDRFTTESEFLTLVGSNPCQGYKYGSKWLVERMPTAVIERLEELVTELGGTFVEIAEVA